MIDLHCHLLPGVDDGPTTLEESLELCQIAVDDGITHAITTPHIHPGRWENTALSIQRDCMHLQQKLIERHIPLQLGFAGEVRLTDQIMRQIAADEIPFYGDVDGFKIMLLEFPHGHIIPGSKRLVTWLLSKQIRPIIAHPERNRQIMADPREIRDFTDAGCWLQATAGSVIGSFGTRAREVVNQLLEEDLVHVLASDGHNAKARQPSLKSAFDVVAKRHGDSRAVRLTRHTPAKIVESQFSGRDIAL